MEKTLTLSLISHTNVGKTTLARTLLRRDVGDIGDRAHVTDESTSYDLIEAGGEVLRLWDTPGFGDTAKLVKRLRESESRFAWLREQVWDRFADRPLFSSQEAVKNVREEADAVLYLVNAAEDTASAGYVDLEMEVLTWIGKPVLVLLNQTGAPRAKGAADPEVTLWREHLGGFDVVKEVVGLDAFSRCWVHERELFRAVERAVGDALKPMAGRLSEAWEAANNEVFEKSIEVLESMLAESVADRVEVSEETFVQKIGIGRGEINRELRGVRKAMAERLAERIKTATDQLIELHGLEGESARRMARLSEENYTEPERVNESLWSAIGGGRHRRYGRCRGGPRARGHDLRRWRGARRDRRRSGQLLSREGAQPGEREGPLCRLDRRAPGGAVEARGANLPSRGALRPRARRVGRRRDAAVLGGGGGCRGWRRAWRG